MNTLKKMFAFATLKLGGFKRSNKLSPWTSTWFTGTGVLGLGIAKLLSILGISVVTHSSGAAIVTAGSGYIAGTYGLGATLLWIFTVPLAIVVFPICIILGIILLFKSKKEMK